MLNQTPHDITIIKADSSTVTIPKSADLTPARVATTQVVVGTHPTAGVDTVRTEYGAVENLVDLETAKQAGGVLVSALVLGRLGAEWSGVAFAPDTSPTGIVRDENGQILGVKQLVTV